MNLLEELLNINEASVAMRAWNGKLKRIDALIGWMYSKDILTNTDKNAKDKVFNQYYRFYNAGDIPAALKKQGFSKYDVEYRPEKIETALEKYLEDFIKRILKKYLPKSDRQEFRIDHTLENLKTVISVAKNHDAYGLLNYWLKKVKIKDEDGKLFNLVEDMRIKYQELFDKLNKVDPSSSNTTLSYRREQMKRDKKWTSEFETLYNKMTDTVDQVTDFLLDLQDSLIQLKKLKAEL